MSKKKLCIFIWLIAMVITMCVLAYEVGFKYFVEPDIGEIPPAILCILAGIQYFFLLMIPEIDVLLGIIFFERKQICKFRSVIILNILSMSISIVAVILIMGHITSQININGCFVYCLLGAIIFLRIAFWVLKSLKENDKSKNLKLEK